MKRIAFFNNKGGVGKTTLVYHVAHRLVDLGKRVLLLDLDPQSNLTSMCVKEERVEELWPNDRPHKETILGCVRPILTGTGDDIARPHVEPLREGLVLLPGDLGLSSFEDKLSDAWPPRALDGSSSEAALRTLSAFFRIAELANEDLNADYALLDVGPNLGAINRAALIAADFIVTPLAPDLYSLQGLRNLGPKLRAWRDNWAQRKASNDDPDLVLPGGLMQPLGYVVMQAVMRLSRPIRAYERWIARIPGEYHESVLSENTAPSSTSEDPWCLGMMRNYQSLMPLAHDAQKPMFHLKPGDGAIGSQMVAVARCREDFDQLSKSILRRVEQLSPTT